MLKQLSAAVLAAYVLPSSADIPVHCLRHEVVGEWRFFLTKPSPARTACGHNRPDKEEAQPARVVVDGSKAEKELMVMLSEPNNAKVDANNGTWTMIYDEGFEVKAGNQVFFAFSNFTFEDKPTRHNVTHCGDTMVGWYSNSDRSEFGCYYGVKSGETAPTVTPSKAKKVGTATPDKPLDHKTQTKKVARINKAIAMMQLGWKARVMPQYNGQTMKQVNGYAGIQRKVPVHDLHRDMMEQRVLESKKERSFLQLHGRARRMRRGAVPDTWNWADVDGRDFTEPVMDQGSCGSCYDASTMRMLTARHKITTNNTEAVPWSINFPLHCSEYNQGCKGGFGFLTTKWSQDVGLIPATCMKYDTEGSCKLECDLDKELKGQKRYRAGNHRYINSFYGNFSSGDEEIKEEIYRNGPVVLSFEPAEDFMFYSEGIYRSPNSTSKLRKHVDFDQEWERVDHAVVCHGWGEENGQKYWLIQNSWGPDWGEDGFFRMARGVDESGIEGCPEASDVVEDEQNGRQVAALFAENAKHAK